VADEIGKPTGSASPEERRMKLDIPLAELIERRMEELGLDRQALGFRLGYRNPLKAAGRVDALREGHIISRKSQAALERLPLALEIAPEVVEQAVMRTLELFGEIERKAEDERRRAAEAEEAECRRTFEPHAVILTERTFPSSIVMCGLTGGIERWLLIPLDRSRSPVTYIQQVMQELPDRLKDGSEGRRFVPYFGEALGFVINFTPDEALRCDLEGRPLEILVPPARSSYGSAVTLCGQESCQNCSVPGKNGEPRRSSWPTSDL